MKSLKAFSFTPIPQQINNNRINISHDQREDSQRKHKLMDGVTEQIQIKYIIDLIMIEIINNIVLFHLRLAHGK